MKNKLSKILAVTLSLIAIVSVLVVSVSAYSAPYVPANPSAPTLYGMTTNSQGESTYRNCGGYIPVYKSLLNNRNSWYFYNQYWTFNGVSANPNPYGLSRSISFYSSILARIPLADGFGLYGASTSRSDSSENYLYFAPYTSANCLDLWFGWLVADESGNVYHYSDIGLNAKCFIAMTFVDDRNFGKVYNCNNHATEYDMVGYANYSQIETIGDLLLPSYDWTFSDGYDGIKSAEDLEHIYPVTIQLSFDIDVDNEVVYPYVYFAISHFDKYVEDYSYAKGLRNFSYDSGFYDGAQITDFGVFSFLSSSINGVLNFEIFDGFYIWTLLSIVICIPLFIWIIKLFAGG